MKLRMMAAAFGLSVLATGHVPGAGAQQLPVFVEFRVQKAPTGALVGDTAASLGYELHITNVTAAPLTLRRVEVLDERDGRVLLTLQDSALLREIARPGPAVSAPDRAKIEGGMRAVVFLWVGISKSNPPSSVRQRLTFQRALPDTTAQILEGASVRVSTDIPVIGPPLRGEWLAANGPSNASGHRRSMVTLGGSMAIGQRYAIDYLQVDEKGQTFQGDRTKNANFFAQGEEVLSVADGVVVQTKDSIPENVPGINSRAVPITLETVAGNNIVVDIGNGRFALYAHLQPGSLRVRVGDRVQRGQVLGLVGNSGNSTEPHLHFHLADALAPGTSTLGAEGIPYVHESLDVLGSCALAAAITCTRSAAVTRAGIMPAQNQLVRFPAPTATVATADYSAPAGAPYTAESVTVPTPMGHTLAGTLTLPRGASRTRPVGVLVTITGSGAQDRDEGMAQIGYQPFRQFADSLSRRGFAVLRMDDRGTGQSKGTWRGSTSADFAEDIPRRAGLAAHASRDRYPAHGSDRAQRRRAHRQHRGRQGARSARHRIAGRRGPARTRGAGLPDEEPDRPQHSALADTKGFGHQGDPGAH